MAHVPSAPSALESAEAIVTLLTVPCMRDSDDIAAYASPSPKSNNRKYEGKIVVVWMNRWDSKHSFDTCVRFNNGECGEFGF